MKFVDVKNDVAFRKIFGNENKKVILISFLNAVLGLEGQNRVKEVTLLNPFQLPRLAGEKSSIIDVRATDEKGKKSSVRIMILTQSKSLLRTSNDPAKTLLAANNQTLLTPR